MLSNSESEDQDDSLIASNGANYYNTMSNTSISTSSNSFSSPLNNYQMHQQAQQQQQQQSSTQQSIDNASSFQLMPNSLQLLNDITQLNNNTKLQEQSTSYFDLSNSIGTNCYNMPSLLPHTLQQQNSIELNVADSLSTIKHFENLV